MTRSVIPLNVPDLSALARQLRRTLAEHLTEHADLPGHQAMLNHIARAAGHRNLQALQASSPSKRAAPADPAAAPALSAAATKALGSFDRWGRMSRWPHKYSVQRLALWVLWSSSSASRLHRTRGERRSQGLAHLGRPRHAAPRTRQPSPAGAQERRLGVPQAAARADDEVRALMAAWRAAWTRRPLQPATPAQPRAAAGRHALSKCSR